MLSAIPALRPLKWSRSRHSPASLAGRRLDGSIGERSTEATKRRLGERLLGDLYRHVPAIEGAVKTWELSTPLSTRHFVGAARGQIYGLAHSPERFLSRDLRPRTPIQSLFLTGQDVATCGVMGALSGAVTTASAMLGRNLFGVTTRETKPRCAA